MRVKIGARSCSLPLAALITLGIGEARNWEAWRGLVRTQNRARVPGRRCAGLEAPWRVSAPSSCKGALKLGRGRRKGGCLASWVS